jgi:hypothetical protein
MIRVKGVTERAVRSTTWMQVRILYGMFPIGVVLIVPFVLHSNSVAILAQIRSAQSGGLCWSWATSRVHTATSLEATS